jgi:putative tryptophan/tyrosine transport system substrate-binding protein
MNRRAFITLIGGAAAAPSLLWPLVARAQQPERMRRVGALMSQGEADPVAQVRYAAFLQGLQQSGWEVGRNLRLDTRWTAAVGSAERMRQSAAELAALAPDVILATGSAATAPLLHATRSIPIVFVHTPDPVGSGFVSSMSRPGGNATGFINFEYAIGAKWLELLKEIAPRVTRAAIVRDAAIAAGIGMWGAIQAVAPSLGIDVVPVNVHEVGEIERAIAAFAQIPNGGMIVTGSGLAITHRDLIVTLAARHKLPAVYFERAFVAVGGLASYGADLVEQYRQAAGYVDRILKGEKPSDLPVQAPTKYELVINLKTANALGLEVPPTLLARANEVIE